MSLSCSSALFWHLLRVYVLYTAAPGEVRQLKLKQRVSDNGLRRPNENGNCFLGMSAGAAKDELFLADEANKVVRVFNVRSGQLDARDVYRCPAGQDPDGVAYCAHTDTLFIATCGRQRHIILSFARENTESEWRECNHIELTGYQPYHVSLCALSDGSLVFGVRDYEKELRVLQVDDARAIQQRARVKLPGTHCGVDAMLAGDETWLAVALCTPNHAVALFRVDGTSTRGAKELSRCALESAFEPLFCGDSVLVYGRSADNTGWEVHEFGTVGGRLEPRRVILNVPDPQYFHARTWCIGNGGLVAWNFEHLTLTIYSLM